MLVLAGCGAPARPKPAATASPTPTAPVAATLNGQPPSALRLDTVDFLNSQVGWLAAHQGSRAQILRTLDGGATWEALPAGAAPFLNLDFPSPDQGWALLLSGTQVEIAHTPDGGASWSVQWLGAAPGMQYVVAMEDARIHMLNTESGYALFGGQLLLTRDGGAQWRAVTMPDGFTPTSMAFADPTHGWVAGKACAAACHAAVLQTADGGSTWAPSFTSAEAVAPEAAGAALPGIAFPTASDGWLYFKAPDLSGRLYATSDGGATWSLLRKGLQTGRTVAGLPVFADARTGWLPVDNGAAPFSGGIEVTHDGGQTWTWVGGDRGWSILALSALSPTSVWAVGRPAGSATQSFLVRTSDGGSTWTEDPLTLRPTAAVDFVSQAQGYGAGSASDPGAVLQTGDGGATWTIRARFPGSVLALSFTDATHGWALEQPWPAGQQLLEVMGTTDGGTTWTQVGAMAQSSVPVPDALRFFDAQHGVMVIGAMPDWLVLSSSDGGHTWAQSGHLAMAPGTPLLPALPSSGNLMLLGGGSLQRSADGGQTWTVVPGLPTSADPIGFGASGPQDLWVVTQAFSAGQTHTTLLRSADGGKTWRTITLPGSMSLDGTLSVSAQSPANAWLLSMEGLFGTRDGGRTWTWLR